MDKKTINTYNQLAIEYDLETADFWQRFPRDFFDKFAGLVGKKILDVGSGPGRDALILKEKGLEVVCLDASEEMVKICSEKGLKAIVGDFNNLPFPDGSFDGVWSYTALLHVPKSEIQIPIQEIKRALKKNGLFGLGLIEGEGEIYKETAGVNMPRLFSFYKEEEIKELLKRNGFELLFFQTFKPGNKNYLNFIARKK
jgi:ubiquinone/menaquinone biosynthesis C-methylase UbiE